MADDGIGNLTPDEAGAFVAQWSEHHPVTLEELTQKLGIDESSISSLVNRSRGRLSMEKWAPVPKPTTSGPSSSSIAAATAAIVGLLLGAAGTFLLMPRTSAESADQAPPSNSNPATAVTLNPGSGNPSGGLGAPGGSPAGAGISGGPQALPGPGAGGIDPKLVKYTPNRSANAALEATGISIPSDLLVAIHLPTINYVVKGREVHDAAGADALTAGQVAKVVDALVTYALSANPPDPAGSGGERNASQAEIQLKVGRAFNSSYVPWTEAYQTKLASMYKDPSSSEAKTLIQPLLDKIRDSRIGKLPDVIPHLSGGGGFAANPAPPDPTTADLKAQGIVIPDDFNISINTSGLFAGARGKRTKSPYAAHLVREETIEKILRALVAYAEKKKPLLPTDGARAPGTDTAFIMLGVGNAGKTLTLHWTQSSKDMLASLFTDTKSPGSQQLVIPFMQQVRQLGAGLFRQSLW